MPTPKTWFITGVSSGFGRELATQALACGNRVIGTLRNETQRAAFDSLDAARRDPHRRLPA